MPLREACRVLTKNADSWVLEAFFSRHSGICILTDIPGDSDVLPGLQVQVQHSYGRAQSSAFSFPVHLCAEAASWLPVSAP